MHLERVRRSPQWVDSREREAPWRWRRAPLRCVKMCQHQRQGVLVAAMLSRPLGAAQSALLRGASLWAAECGMHVIWPCGGVRPREMCVEGRRRRRRPWKPNNARCCCVVLEAANESAQFQSARPPLSTTPYVARPCQNPSKLRPTKA